MLLKININISFWSVKEDESTRVTLRSKEVLEWNFVIYKGRTALLLVKYWRIKRAWEVVSSQDEKSAHNTLKGKPLSFRMEWTNWKDNIKKDFRRQQLQGGISLEKSKLMLDTQVQPWWQRTAVCQSTASDATENKAFVCRLKWLYFPLY
jgi:hypothetical protein